MHISHCFAYKIILNRKSCDPQMKEGGVCVACCSSESISLSWYWKACGAMGQVYKEAR